MTRKLIAFAFEQESIGGFGIVCGPAHYGRHGAFSHCIPMTKQAFLEACKDRIKFNELLGIDIREGWQNALKDAIEPFTTMTEDCDPDVAAKAIAEMDVNIRGEEAVKQDMETLEADNQKMIAEVEQEVKPSKKGTKKPKKTKKEITDDEGRADSAEAVSEDNGCSESDGISAETGSTTDNA